jgi:exopolysaccharide biosynthesis protein
VLSPAKSIDLDLVIFDSRQLRLAVIDQPNPNAGGRSIAHLMRQYNAIAGVNGGFFSPEFKPLGLSVSNGRLLSSFTTSSLIAGTALQLGDQSYLIWNSEYQGHSNITDALQAGPRLLESSRPIKGLDTSKSRARTFIATDGSFLWAIGTADSCSLGALAQALATPGALPGLTPMRALNLDGGNSTALWFRNLSGKETSRPGWSTVRNYLAIIPK